MNENTYLWTFLHRDREVTFGPHRTLWEACESFQWRYGYWPGALSGKEQWSGTAD